MLITKIEIIIDQSTMIDFLLGYRYIDLNYQIML